MLEKVTLLPSAGALSARMAAMGATANRPARKFAFGAYRIGFLNGRDLEKEWFMFNEFGVLIQLHNVIDRDVMHS